MKNIVYFKICSNENEYKKISRYKVENYKTIKSRIINYLIEKINHYKFRFMIKSNYVEKMNINERQMFIIYVAEGKEEKILKKINHKVIQIENENRNIKIILSKQIKSLIKKYENVQNIEKLKEILENSIYDKELYKQVLDEVLKSIISLRKEVPEEQSMYILLNSNNGQYMPLIRKLIENYKMLNIVTKNFAQFKTFEENAEKNFEAVSILNNKRKSIAKAKYIINVDLKNEELAEYCINRTATIFNISDERKINLNNFDGIIINNININKPAGEFDFKDYFIENTSYLEEILQDIKEYKYELEGNKGRIEFKMIQE